MHSIHKVKLHLFYIYSSLLFIFSSVLYSKFHFSVLFYFILFYHTVYDTLLTFICTLTFLIYLHQRCGGTLLYFGCFTYFFSRNWEYNCSCYAFLFCILCDKAGASQGWVKCIQHDSLLRRRENGKLTLYVYY